MYVIQRSRPSRKGVWHLSKTRTPERPDFRHLLHFIQWRRGQTNWVDKWLTTFYIFWIIQFKFHLVKFRVTVFVSWLLLDRKLLNSCHLPFPPSFGAGRFGSLKLKKITLSCLAPILLCRGSFINDVTQLRVWGVDTFVTPHLKFYVTKWPRDKGGRGWSGNLQICVSYFRDDP